MIGFSQYLTEARMAPLYHSTRLNNLPSIIRSNTLNPSLRRGTYGGFEFSTKDDAYESNGTMGVSLTRSFKTAYDWYGQIILELDQLKLIQNYKITPINMTMLWSKGKNAKNYGVKYEELYEEMVFGPIKNLNRYLTGFYLKDDFEKFGGKFDAAAVEIYKSHPLYKGVRKHARV